MYDLPQQFCDLSPARQRKLAGIRTKERQDAAMNTVVIGLKALNHVYGFGLNTLASLSTKWGKQITDFYNAGNDIHPDSATWHMPILGELHTDIRETFGDLSERRCREIMTFLVGQRYEASGNAVSIGMKTIHDELGFGDTRLQRLWRQWGKDIHDLYSDRETNYPRLVAWIEDIGFCFEDGKLQTYTCRGTGKITRKHTVERMLADAEQKI